MGWREDIAAAGQTPAYDTLEAARAFDSSLTRDEYTLARIIKSEHGSGTPDDMCCIGDADCNKAKAAGKSIFDHATGGTGSYGGQGGARPVSTARSPGPRHIKAALAVLRWRWWFVVPTPPPARGIAKGARRYFDPKTQDVLHARDPRSNSCSAIGLLEAWTFARPKCNGVRCCANGLPVDGPNGSGQEEWVGPIAGVDAWQLMLMRPKTNAATQRANYELARKVIESRGAFKPSASGGGDLLAFGLVVLGLAAAGYAAGGIS